MKQNIVVKGAKMHNLKNIDVSIPKNQFTVITGVSGSGKSSLAFDTIYAEGQRRYVESLSTYARQFLKMMSKPEVESIEGLSPAIAIDQKSTSRNPRSTVGTVTEIYDYLRLLYAKVGTPHCSECGKVIEKQSPQDIIDKISSFEVGKKIMIMAPIIQNKKGSFLKEIGRIKKEGFIRLRVDGKIVTVNEEIELDEEKEHSIDIVVDRLVVKDYSSIKKELSSGDIIEDINPDRTRLVDSIEIALKHGEGKIIVVDFETNEEMLFSETYTCSDHPSISVMEIEPRSFSFNSPKGACTECHGLGEKLLVQPELVIPNVNLTLGEGAIHPWATHTWHLSVLTAVAKKHEFSLDTKYKNLTEKQKAIVLYGTGDMEYKTEFKSKKLQGDFNTKFEGVINNIERKYLETDSDHSKSILGKYMKTELCPLCHGKKLRTEVLNITIKDKNIIDICDIDIEESVKFFSSIMPNLTKSKQKIANQIIEEIINRLNFLLDVGLPYLSLNRTANTLSGGESQRIRLATQIGSALTGVLYVLDEPSIGLHQKDNDRLIGTIKNLKNIGNTVLVVEHDKETMLAADHLLEIGPKAGEHGGNVIAEGSPEEFLKNDKSITAMYLSGRKEISIPEKRRKGNGNFIELKGANGNNLKNVDVSIPLGTLVGVSGVSGSGKSTLINYTLATELSHRLHRAEKVGMEFKELNGIENIDKIIHIDQKAIGRTPRSNPATYTKVFDDIRALFAAQPDAKLRGYDAGRFSFNVKGGRCESCKGEGMKKVNMHFLSDIYVPCDICKGKRYNHDALEIKWRSFSIADVLEMTVEQAIKIFATIPNINNKLQTIIDVGLGYMHLGQSAITLSGGEAQRVKLATELSRKSTGRTIYILDEPTTGLHFQDIKQLLEVLQRLVDKGNTVILIEHNMDVLKTCDYLIDVGPDGGKYGGEIVAKGTPEEVSNIEKSYTGIYLKKELK